MKKNGGEKPPATAPFNIENSGLYVVMLRPTSCRRELDVTATDLSSQVLTDVLTRIPGLTWLAAGQLDGMTDEASLKGFTTIYSLL